MEIIKFSINLIELTISHLEFLDSIHREVLANDGRMIKQAVYRYEKFWLPFYSEQIQAGERAQNLYPPWDIAWVWHCHLLSPIDYRKDCLTVLGIEKNSALDHLDHFCFSMSEIVSKQAYTRKKAATSDDLKLIFDVPLSSQSLSYESKISYDLIGSSSRQKSFYYQVSLPHFRSENFLKQCVDQYSKFLYLKKLKPELANYVAELI